MQTTNDYGYTISITDCGYDDISINNIPLSNREYYNDRNTPYYTKCISVPKDDKDIISLRFVFNHTHLDFGVKMD